MSFNVVSLFVMDAELHEEYCNLDFQIGGNDQLGNIVSGYELIKRITNESVFGKRIYLCAPLSFLEVVLYEFIY